MTTTLHTEPGSSTPAGPGVLFGRSAEGFLAARVGDNAFAMLPGGDGRYYLASAWYIARPIAEWTRSDFYGHSGELADEAAFRAQVEENALHQRQRSALDIMWAGLVWTSFVYCAWMFFRHIAAGFAGAGDAATFEGVFSSAAEASVLFGMLALMGSARVSHVLKQIDAEASSRSEGVEKLMRDGLGGLLLLGFAVTCLVLTGSRVGFMITGGVVVLHAWWDTRTLVRHTERGLVRRVIGRVTPFLAIGVVAWGIWLAYAEDESVADGLAGAVPFTSFQRLQTYWFAFQQHPVFGIGLGNLEIVRDHVTTLANARALLAPGDAQNVALSWLVEAGVAGTAALTLLLGAMHVQLARGLGSRHAPRTFLRLALAASLLLLIHGLTDSSLSLPSLVLLYAFLLGAGCGVASWRRPSSSGASQEDAGS